ncbi:hypothetical protein B0I21_10922 [Sphingobacterium paludis]|uniref:Uncharacterized protein n=1 Tax=Sphingobacterium paludis TaxID=1476465 RepID=A0A4R7CVI6_9SPHI|nr:hypothetical protein B0I21_10922 [Sphingobacterium paludis]
MKIRLTNTTSTFLNKKLRAQRFRGQIPRYIRKLYYAILGYFTSRFCRIFAQKTTNFDKLYKDSIYSLNSKLNSVIY